MKGRGVGDVREEVSIRVRIGDRALVPVLGDSLLAYPDWLATIVVYYQERHRSLTLVGSVAAGLSIDGEPALDHIVAELSRRRLLTVVGHEAVDEGVCCGLHQDTGEWTVEEVWVGLFLGVETLGTEGCQGLHGHEATGRGINQFLELVCLSLVVVAIYQGQLSLSL